MRNLLNSTDIATIFVDIPLRVKRFTQRALRLIRFIPSDVGRPLADLVTTLNASADVIGKRGDVASCDGVTQLQALKQRALETEQDGEEEVVFELPGGPRTYRIAVEPLRKARGDVIGRTTATIDVTPIQPR